MLRGRVLPFFARSRDRSAAGLSRDRRSVPRMADRKCLSGQSEHNRFRRGHAAAKRGRPRRASVALNGCERLHCRPVGWPYTRRVSCRKHQTLQAAARLARASSLRHAAGRPLRSAGSRGDALSSRDANPQNCGACPARGHAESRLRPFARRADRTRRPPGVAILARKP
jgi:hypothetical protein